MTTCSPSGCGTRRDVVTSLWDAGTTACSTFGSTRRGRPWFLEAGLYCSYSPGSVIAVMASAIGISVPQLFEIGLSE